MDNRDHFEIYNDTDNDCPAGGVCMFSGDVTENGVLKVIEPDADSLANLVVTNFFLPARATGSGTLDNRVILTLDSAGGPCADGDTVGSQAGWFLAKKGKFGFVCVGGSNGLQPLAVRVSVGDIPSAETGSSTANYTITASNAWQDARPVGPTPGLPSITLPGDGTYLVVGNVTMDGQLQNLTSGSVTAGIGVRLKDAVTGAVVHGTTGGVTGTAAPSGGFVATVADIFGKHAFAVRVTIADGVPHTLYWEGFRQASIPAPTSFSAELGGFDIIAGASDPATSSLAYWLTTGVSGGAGPPGPPGATGATGPPGASGTIDGTTATTFTGVLAGNGSNVAARTLTGTANQITLTNGTGAAGNPTFGVSPAVVAAAGSYVYLN